jgi:hypothetical protein
MFWNVAFDELLLSIVTEKLVEAKWVRGTNG